METSNSLVSFEISMSSSGGSKKILFSVIVSISLPVKVIKLGSSYQRMLARHLLSDLKRRPTPNGSFKRLKPGFGPVYRPCWKARESLGGGSVDKGQDFKVFSLGKHGTRCMSKDRIRRDIVSGNNAEGGRDFYEAHRANILSLGSLE